MHRRGQARVWVVRRSVNRSVSIFASAVVFSREVLRSVWSSCDGGGINVVSTAGFYYSDRV